MTTQRINIGETANDGTGDSIRDSFQKCNSNFDTIDSNKSNIVQNTIDIATNISDINNNTTAITSKANDSDVLKKDGSISLNDGYSPTSNLDIATKSYVDTATTNIITNTNNIALNTTAIDSKANDSDILKKDGSVSLNAGYNPTSNLDIATKSYVDTSTINIATNTNNITSNTTAIASKANDSDVLKKDGSISLNAGYNPNLDLDISTKKYVDDSISGIETGTGASETDLLTISSSTEKFSDGVSDINQNDWNTRAKNKIEANTTNMASKATQIDVTNLTTRVTTAEGNISKNTSSINGLATVANSGNYNDLINTPSIPSKTSDITNDSNFITNISTFNTDNLIEGSTNKYDKTVSLTGGADINVTGTYPNFTINSTTTGGSASPKMISGGILSNNSIDSDEVIDISSVIARSSDDTQDININAGSLDITNNTSWASGTVPNLATTEISVWADYNSGSSRFILDDVTGSNVFGSKRKIGACMTDSNGNIIPFICTGKNNIKEYSFLNKILYLPTKYSTFHSQSFDIPTGCKKISIFWFMYDPSQSSVDIGLDGSGSLWTIAPSVGNAGQVVTTTSMKTDKTLYVKWNTSEPDYLESSLIGYTMEV